AHRPCRQRTCRGCHPGELSTPANVRGRDSHRGERCYLRTWSIGATRHEQGNARGNGPHEGSRRRTHRQPGGDKAAVGGHKSVRPFSVIAPTKHPPQKSLIIGTAN